MNPRHLLRITAGLLLGCTIPAGIGHALPRQDGCLQVSVTGVCTEPGGPSEPPRIDVIQTQPVMLDVLPISVIYAPPGVCDGTSDCPSQHLKSSSSFGTALTITDSTETTISQKGGVKVNGGDVKDLGFGGSMSVSFESSDQASTTTTNKQQVVVVDVTQLAASLHPTDSFTDLLPSGSRPGGRDVIAFMEHPVFKVSTKIGTALATGTALQKKRSFQPLTAPVTASVVPDFNSLLKPACPPGVACSAWTERAVTVDQIRTQLSGGNGGIPELSADDLKQLLAFDPMAGANPQSALNDPSGRFQKQPIAYAWTPCDSQIQPEISQSTTDVTSSTQANSFTTKVTVGAEVSLGWPLFSVTASYETGDSTTWTYSTNTEVTQMQGTDASAQFGGNGDDTGMCGNPVTTNVYLDTVSGSLLFHTLPPPLQFPGNLGNVMACLEDSRGAAARGVPVEVIPAHPAQGQPTVAETVTTDGQGCVLLTLDAGAYILHDKNSPSGQNEQTLDVIPSLTTTFAKVPAFRLAAPKVTQPPTLQLNVPNPILRAPRLPRRLS